MKYPKRKKTLILSGCKKINDIYFSKEIWKEKQNWKTQNFLKSYSNQANVVLS